MVVAIASAADHARAQVDAVSDNADARLALLHDCYEYPNEREGGPARLPFKRAAVAFMRWQLRRGLLNRLDDPSPGSPWWRAINDRFLRDSCEARLLAAGAPGPPSSPSVGAGLQFIERPTVETWYRAHNMTIVSAYLENTELAWREDRVERFVINLVLLRVLYAHALVASPRLALGALAPLGPLLGDPRLGMTAMFLSLSRVLPTGYPLGNDIDRILREEHTFGRLLDAGVIEPRRRRLYDWSAAQTATPGLATLLEQSTPAYAWDPTDTAPWHGAPTRLQRYARLL